MTQGHTEFFVNQRVRHSENPEQIGTIRYVGPISGQSNHYCGVEWDTPVGKYDGEYQGTRYFSCAPLHGSFVHIKRLCPATGLWDAILDRYITGRDVSSIDEMFVTDGIKDTKVHFYGQSKLDKYHKHLENLTDIDLQGYDIGYLSSTNDLSGFSRLSNLRFLELSFTLLNDPISVLTLLCIIPSLEVILVNGCNIRWYDLFETECSSSSRNLNTNSPVSIPKKRPEFVKLLQQLRRRERKFSIYTNATMMKKENDANIVYTNANITSLSLRALLYLPNLTGLYIDFWSLSCNDISWIRHKSITQLSAVSSFIQPLSDVLPAMARAFPKIEDLTLRSATKYQQKYTINSSIHYNYLHVFHNLKTLNLSGKSLDIDLLRSIHRLCPLLQNITYEDICVNGIPIPRKEHKAYTVAMLGSQIKTINWIPMQPEDISSEERFYISIWFIGAMKMSGNDLREHWRNSPELITLLQKHNLQLPASRIRHLLESVPEIRKEAIKGLSDWVDKHEDEELTSVGQRYRGKLVEITLLDSHYTTDKDYRKILLPKSTCVWRLVTILKENYGIDVSQGMIASGKHMYGESINNLSLYTPIGDIVGTECRIRA